MGHRRFVQEKQKPIEHSYSRTPNPQARNYFNEMAPVNGIVEYEQVVFIVFSTCFISLVAKYIFL